MIAAIADVHGNHWALNAVLDALPEAVETVVCAGDLVGYGPHPAACVRTVREVADVVVRGNHDRYVTEPRTLGVPGLDRLPRYGHLRLSAADRQWLASLPERATVAGYLVVHHWPGRSFSPRRSRVTPELDGLDGVITGHWHRQEHYTVDGVSIVDPGPVGEPRPSKLVTSPLSASLSPRYALIDPATGEVRLERTSYPSVAALGRWAAGLLGRT